MVQPRNYLLFACHAANESAQVRRKEERDESANDGELIRIRKMWAPRRFENLRML